MAEIKRHLSGARLLTLSGAGGAGKTRLALQVAADLLESFPDGTWLVEIAGLADETLVPQAAATALGITESAGSPITARLVNYLSGKRLLLILDNCEHLIRGVASLADSLLRSCPMLQIMATSREANRSFRGRWAATSR